MTELVLKSNIYSVVAFIFLVCGCSKPREAEVDTSSSPSAQQTLKVDKPQAAGSGSVGGASGFQNLQGTWDCGRNGISRNTLTFEKPNTFIQQEIVYSDTVSTKEVSILKLYFSYKLGDANRQGSGISDIDFTRGKIVRTLKTAEAVTTANTHHPQIHESAACLAITYAVDQETDVTACVRADNIGPVMYSTIKLTEKNISLGNCYPNSPNCDSPDKRGEFLLDPCDKAL